MRALFINSKAKKCSIHESGLMIFDCLKNSKVIDFEYCEVDKQSNFVDGNYDLYLFNYHYGTMNWLDTSKLRNLIPNVFTIVLEVSPNNPFVLVGRYDFDAYLVIDPTIKDECNVWSFPRPIEKFNHSEETNNKTDIPVIGSFGLPTPGKGFVDVVEAVNKEFENAIVRINIPNGDFTNDMLAEVYKLECLKTAKKGIDVQITNYFFNKNELIKWLSENTINIFLYNRNQPGLAATVDQCISAGRPLLTNNNDTFRHITKYIKPYPEQSIKEAIKNTPQIVKMLQQNWSNEAFSQVFDNKIKNYNFKKGNFIHDKIALPIK